MANPTLDNLRVILQKEGLLNKTIPFQKRYEWATKIPAVREIFDFRLPPVSDISDILQISGGGRVFALRMDLNSGVDNHKKFVVAGLILRGMLIGRIPHPKIDTLIDGGNFNSAKALKYYAAQFGMKGIYIMSYLFPSCVTDLLESENFHVIRAPHKHKYKHAREREFYEFLFEQMQHQEFNRNKFCLWHAKYGGKVEYPLGREIAESFSFPVDCSVSCLGAGSTLEGLQLPVEDVLREKGLSCQVFIAEHELSPLFAKSIQVESLPRDVIPAYLADPDRYLHVREIPHVVIGPHYDEINQLLSQKSIARIDGIVQYSENDWQATQSYLSERGMVIGNSSAANVSAAWRLAKQGRRVFTVIFEPLREFLIKQKT